MIAISEHMKNLYETGYNNQICKIPARRCYNGIDLTQYPLQKDKSDKLLFLGRIDPIKGVHTSIDVAEKAKTPIDIVGATEFVANKQYVHEIRTKCSQSKYANFVGEVSHEDKVRYLQNAKALVTASSFGEPFGLMYPEALSCGTPVISTDDGAAKEIITEDTGFICNSVDKMVSAVSQLSTISTEDCRKRAERFSYQRMCERLEELYKRIIYENDAW